MKKKIVLGLIAVEVLAISLLSANISIRLNKVEKELDTVNAKYIQVINSEDIGICCNAVACDSICVVSAKSEEEYEHDIKMAEYEQKLKAINKTNETEWFAEYFNLVCEYKKYTKMQTLEDVFTQEEIRYMCKTVETEVYDKDFKSKTHVASVILNRYYDGRFGSDLKTIVTNPKQFAYGRDNITDSTKLACEYAFLMGDTTHGALYFDSNKALSRYYDKIFTDTVGHNFYRERNK